MKVKKFIMVLLFILGGSELLVGFCMGFYPSLVMGSCLLYGAVALRNRVIKKQAQIAVNTAVPLSKRHVPSFKAYFLPVGLFLFAAMFICSSLITRTFPGIATGILFGFFATTRILDILKKRSNYHVNDGKTIY